MESLILEQLSHFFFLLKFITIHIYLWLWELYNNFFPYCKTLLVFNAQFCLILINKGKHEMKTILFRKKSMFNILFLFLFLFSTAACEQKRKLSNKLKIDTEEFNINQNSEAQFLINTSNLSKNIIAATEMAISKSTNQDIIQFSIELKKEQQLLLEDVNKLANNNLIIITELNSNDVKKNRSNIIVSQETNFEEQYIDYLFFALDQEIKFFEEIILQTQDVDIKNFVNDAIPKQEEFIEQMYNLKNETIYKQL